MREGGRGRGGGVWGEQGETPSGRGLAKCNFKGEAGMASIRGGAGHWRWDLIKRWGNRESLWEPLTTRGGFASLAFFAEWFDCFSVWQE